MSVKATNWVWGLPLTGSAKLVLLCLADHADNDGVCWPGLAAVSEKTGVAQRTLNRVVGELEADGLIRRENRKDGEGRQQSNKYFLDLNNERLKQRTDQPCANMAYGEAEMPCAKSGEPCAKNGGSRAPTVADGTTKNDRTVTKPSIESSARAREIRVEQDRIIGIPDTLKAKWRQVFPGIDIEREIALAELWLAGPPRRHKQDYARFLTSWMSKARPGESVPASRARAVCAVCGAPSVMTVGKAAYCDQHGTGALL